MQWSMAISVEDFIPSLTGYVQSQPIITALRLCNRYGKGPACFVNRLPTELIELIESHIHVAIRQSAFAEWEQQKKCTEGSCACEFEAHHAFEHMGRRQSRLTSRETVSVGEIDDILAANFPSSSSCTNDTDGCTKLRHVCPHYANICNFSQRTRDFRALDADAQLVRKYFGLNIWTAIKHSYDIHPDDIRLRPLVMIGGADLSPKICLRSQLLLMLPDHLKSRCGVNSLCPENPSLDQDYTAASTSEWKMLRRFLRLFRMLELLPNEGLRLLEKFVNVAEAAGGNDTGYDMRERFYSKLAESHQGVNRAVMEGKVWPHVVRVSRPSSWESRMRDGWLARSS
jgi:hypothetical protein